MATNITLPNFPQRMFLTISLPREVNSFRDLNDLAKGLDEIDRLLRKIAPDAWPYQVRGLQRRAVLMRFHVGSPSEFVLVALPTWLTLFITVLASYKLAKENIPEIMADASNLLAQIDGITKDQVQTLTMGVRLMLDRIFQESEEASLKLAKRLHQARARLMGRSRGRVTIIVKEEVERNRSE